jgi:hypothetical protein
VFTPFAIVLCANPPSHSPSVFLAVSYLLLVFAVLIYLFYLGLRAGWRYAESRASTKDIVSEIDRASYLPIGWFSKVLGIPVPIRYIKKNKAPTTGLFIVSGLAFSAFWYLAFRSVIFVGRLPAAMVLDSSVVTFYFPALKGSGAMAEIISSNVMALSVFEGLAFLSLLVGLAARGGARRLLSNSINETLAYDLRPPILFLRSFQDDQVALRRAKLSLLGRLVNLFQAKENLDAVLKEEGTPYGPCGSNRSTRRTGAAIRSIAWLLCGRRMATSRR